MKNFAILFIAILAALSMAHADEQRLLVAGYVYYATPEHDALMFELGNVEANPQNCQNMKGLKLVHVVATNPRIYPQLIPYGIGCWYPTDDGYILISYVNMRTGDTIERRIPMSKFVTTTNFTRWRDYKPSVR